MSISIGAKTVVNVAGLERLIARIGPASVEAVIDRFAKLIFDEAYPNIPRDTGADAATLEIVRAELSAIVRLGAGLPGGYGALQEIGFHHVGTGQFIQRPALLPAFLMHRDAFEVAIVALVRERG